MTIEGTRDLGALSTPELVAYVVWRYHASLRRTLPSIEALVAEVAGAHGAGERWLPELLGEVRELRAEIEPHLDEEESELFPMLVSRAPDRGRLAEVLARTRRDHETIRRSLGHIRALADDFHAPRGACDSYRAMLRELAALEEDTLRHMHVENHILLPRFARPGDGGAGRGADARRS